MSKITIYKGDNIDVLKTLSDESIDLIYIDPPFNTGKTQRLKSLKMKSDDNSSRIGYGGKKYTADVVSNMSYSDIFKSNDEFYEFLYERLVEAYRILKPSGSLFFHIDYREVHYCKVMLDEIFGRECFLNEIIWAYDYGCRSKTKWPTKHDNILYYVKDFNKYYFDLKECDRIAYMSPDLVGAEKVSQGKTPTDVWWHTIVPTNSREKTGYPTQKPKGIIRRILAVHTSPGDKVLDFFAGSGTLGEVAHELGRECILVDKNEEAIEVMKKRFTNYEYEIKEI